MSSSAKYSPTSHAALALPEHVRIGGPQGRLIVAPSPVLAIDGPVRLTPPQICSQRRTIHPHTACASVRAANHHQRDQRPSLTRRRTSERDDVDAVHRGRGLGGREVEGGTPPVRWVADLVLVQRVRSQRPQGRGVQQACACVT